MILKWLVGVGECQWHTKHIRCPGFFFIFASLTDTKNGFKDDSPLQSYFFFRNLVFNRLFIPINPLLCQLKSPYFHYFWFQIFIFKNDQWMNFWILQFSCFFQSLDEKENEAFARGVEQGKKDVRSTSSETEEATKTSLNVGDEVGYSLIGLQ